MVSCTWLEPKSFHNRSLGGCLLRLDEVLPFWPEKSPKMPYIKNHGDFRRGNFWGWFFKKYPLFKVFVELIIIRGPHPKHTTIFLMKKRATLPETDSQQKLQKVDGWLESDFFRGELAASFRERSKTL